MIGVYKFTNKINNKIYIGQSKNIERRYIRHLYDAKHGSKTMLHQAIRKYGIENFSFDIVAECAINELNYKEKYYIKYFNSIMPYGYNMQSGGQPEGFEPYMKFSKEDILEIYDVITSTTKTFSEIGAEYGVSSTLIGYINTGSQYAIDGITYPIRSLLEIEQIKNNAISTALQGENSYKCTITYQKALEIIDDLINNLDLKLIDIAQKHNTTYDIVKDINRGKSWKWIIRPVPCRPDYGNHKITADDALYAIELLQTTYLSYEEITKIIPNISIRILQRINKGESWRQDTIQYPIRNFMIRKGKLKQCQVLEIVDTLYNQTKTRKEIALEYNVSLQSISDIANHKSYQYLTKDLPTPIDRSL